MFTLLQIQWEELTKWLFSTPRDFAQQAWYDVLHKPFWMPPGWIFRTAWTILYAMIAWVGLRIFFRISKFPSSSKINRWFLLQIITNLLWSPLFFYYHFIWLSWVDCLIIWVANLQTILLLYPEDRCTAYLLMPYQAWLSFACILNGTICFLNS